ncbi:MAG: hypothetical protein AAB758_02560 [Patescibacteria group bacterium]
MEPQPQPEHAGSVGTLVASIVILAILIVGALYLLWGSNSGSTDLESVDTSSLNAVSTQSTSDASADIEADLNATDVDSVDSGLD